MENHGSKKGLTISEKIDQYNKIKEFLINADKAGELRYGFCHAIIMCLDINVYDDLHFSRAFPELYNRKPETDHAYWFPFGKEGFPKRIVLLNDVLIELLDKLHNDK